MLVNLKICSLFLLFISSFYSGCVQRPSTEAPPNVDSTELPPVVDQGDLRLGAERFEAYLPLLEGQRVAMLVNQTSRIGADHLVDRLVEQGVDVRKIFAPEHGFRGEADRRAGVKDGKDEKTGLPITSLYGKKKKATPADLAGIDWVVFDIQDVGVRFYTYIGSMHYMMEACAENDINLLILDRPNPNGHYVDGPILDMAYQSFVGMHPVPVVHGMTVGEYAQMINGEAWLGVDQRCNLKVIPCTGYDHQKSYILPIKPSPNLPNNRSIYLYPSLCFFEGTPISVGRGTDKQFQILGHPDLETGDFLFTPKPMPGASKPVLEGQQCRGFDLTYLTEDDLWEQREVQLWFLREVYQHFPNKDAFFKKNGFFNTLAGGPDLGQQIAAGWTEEEIRATWKEGLSAFKATRQQYLLYPE